MQRADATTGARSRRRSIARNTNQLELTFNPVRGGEQSVGYELVPLNPYEELAAPPPVKAKCFLGHSLSSQYDSGRLHSTRCPVCFPKSFGEEYVRQVMVEMFGAPFPSRRLRELGGLELDGYNEERRLAFEHHGEQHFKETHHFHDRDNPRKTFEAQQERDRKKVRICRELGIKLIIVPAVTSATPPRELVAQLVALLAEQGISVSSDAAARGASISYVTPRIVRRYEQAKEFVEGRGGRVLTGLSEHPYKVDCGKGHIWTVAESNLLMENNWCSACAGRPNLGLEDVQAHLDETRPGWTVKSSTYVNNHSNNLILVCENGHEVGPVSFKVLKKSPIYCRQCPRRKRHTNFSSIDRHAAHLEGRPLSLVPGQKWEGSKEKLWYVCHECDHRWEAKPNSVQNGTGCSQCGLKKNAAKRRRSSIDDLRALAKTFRGTLLSIAFKSRNDDLLWRCASGHEFKAPLRAIEVGHWCRLCDPGIYETLLGRGRAIAASRGGQCNQTLSDSRVGAWSWTCSEGHTFSLTLRQVRRLRWCELCEARELASRAPRTKVTCARARALE